MKRAWFVALSGAIATATIALAMGDASAEYYNRNLVRVGAYDNVLAPGVYRRAARRADRRAAFAAAAVGTAAATNVAGYGAYAAYGNQGAYGNDGTYGSFNLGIYRRAADLNYATPLARAVAYRLTRVSPEAAAAWALYPTRGEYARGYVTPSYYGAQCHPWVDIGCQ